jgi:predicted nucleotidyltransferase component of viral defense system
MANLPEDEAIEIVFKAIALSDRLSEEWVLKGGNALKKAYHSPRASVDLDFTEVSVVSNESEETLETFLEEVVKELNEHLDKLVGPSSYEDLVVQSTQIKPANVDFREHPAFTIKVGYSKRGDREPPYIPVVKLEITLNDTICEDQPYMVDGGEIKVCSLNDIIAEKLRSLIQQKEDVRNRYRPNDVFDIWFFHTRLPGQFDYEKISRFLIEKSKGKFDIALVRKSTFSEDPEIKERASVDFEDIEGRVEEIDRFPTFEEAFEEVLTVVNKLTIPD